MQVQHLYMKQFSAFEDVELAFSPGIDVFLGTNATGKSHAMFRSSPSAGSSPAPVHGLVVTSLA